MNPSDGSKSKLPPRAGGSTRISSPPADRNAASPFGRVFSGIRRLAGMDGTAEAVPGDWRYAGAREISRGGMGTIYRVQDKALERQLALKVALGRVARDPAHIASFIREARITAQLEHPNIVPVHDFGQTPDGAWYYTMKLIHGEPMTRVLSRLQADNLETRAKFDPYQRLLIFHKVCSAIAFAHAHGVIHRDIKPENIMVGAFGEVLLMDWGLAKRLQETAEPAPPADNADGWGGQAPGITCTGFIKGTPAYMSPEQALGLNDEVDAQTDVFLLGSTLYHFMALHPPYTASTAEEVVRMAAEADFVHPEERNPHEQIPDEICRIILRAMASRKADRYRDVPELLADLDRFLAGRTPGERRTFRAGEFLMHAGEQGDEGFVILSGQVEVVLETPESRTQLGVLGPGDIVGEMAALTSETRSADVIALENTEAEVISREAIQAEMRKIAPWMGKVVNSLTSRLRQANEKIHPLLFGDCLMHVARQIRLILPAGMSAEQDVLVSEIARSLALPYDHVAAAMERLLAANILARQPDNSLSIKDSAGLMTVARWKPHPVPSKG
jgi:serine/threonine-protein kinase